MVTVCLQPTRSAVELVESSKRFLLNVVGDDPTEMFKHFGKGFSLEEDAFDGITVRATPFGPLIESCIAHLGCRIVNKHTITDHDLYIAEVVAGGIVDGTKPYIHVRKSGLSY